MGKKKLIVIGGGAAGFFCAVNAARMNPLLDVIIAEKTSKILSKVKVSGGGRCNVTHHCFSIADMIKQYPRGSSFLKKAFHHFFTSDTIKWFAERGVSLKTEPDGRMFPITDSSQTIIDCLLNEAQKNNVQIYSDHELTACAKTTAGTWDITFNGDKNMKADYLCICSGGYPKLSQFDWLKSLGHTIEAPVPSLFTFNMPGNSITALMGLSVENALIKIPKLKLTAQGPLLITHWGMSGPAVLKISAFAARELAAVNWHCSIIVNWLGAYNENTLQETMQLLRKESPSKKIINSNIFPIPQRLWLYQLQQAGIHDNFRWADLPAKEQNKLVKNLCAGEFEVKGKTTFKEEFVTAGGINLTEVDYNTMQSKIIPSLFFSGEVLDIDGVTGGFNFQNAWTTAWIAASAIAKDSAV